MYLVIELVLLVLVLAPLLFIAVTLVRRALIAHGTGVSLCALQIDGSPRWRSGMLTLSSGTLEWYPFAGLTTTPSYRWVRPTLELGRATPAAGEPPWLLVGLSSLQSVSCSAEPLVGGAPEFSLILQVESYMALRSWTESSPPQDQRAGR